MPAGMGPRRVYLMQICKIPQYFQFSFKGIYANCSPPNWQLSDRSGAIFRTRSAKNTLPSYREWHIVKQEYIVNLYLRALALNQVEYLRSSFAHLLPDVSGPGWVVAPPPNILYIY